MKGSEQVRKQSLTVSLFVITLQSFRNVLTFDVIAGKEFIIS